MDKCRVCGKMFMGVGLACPDCVEAMRMKIKVSEEEKDMKTPIRVPKKGTVPPTQQKIHEILGAMTDLLLYKNQKYGDSALNPLGIFTKHIKGVDEKTASILVRIDDKLSRVKNADTLRTNDICDLIGYLTLLNIAIGTTAEDIAKFKD